MVKELKIRVRSEESTTLEISESKKQEYPHIFRPKTLCELLKLSVGVMGIELAYSVETAFVSPILLELGIEHENMTSVWALPSVLGLILGPLLGSLSDRCKSKYGRRRPFITVLFIGLLLGLIFVPYGKDIGRLLGDKSELTKASSANLTLKDFYMITSTTEQSVTFNLTEKVTTQMNSFESIPLSEVLTKEKSINLNASDVLDQSDSIVGSKRSLPIIAVVFTILGTILMDFNADVSQSPIRAYLLEVCHPDDHARGLSLFTVTTGVGGFLGYLVGGLDWEELVIGKWLGGNVKTVFLLITIISITCVMITITSFKEIPLDVLEEEDNETEETKKLSRSEKTLQSVEEEKAIETKRIVPLAEVSLKEKFKQSASKLLASSEFLSSLVCMPRSLVFLSLTNLIIWMSHLSYSLYFTDFVGECVFGGDPAAPAGSESLELYNSGVRFGCWGMAIYCLSCAIYSALIDKLIKKFGAKTVLIGALVIYAIGMALMAICKSQAAVLVLSVTAGIDYSTLSTIPYLILAEYHTSGMFGNSQPSEVSKDPETRGLGMDIAILTSTIFVAQLVLSLCLGGLIQLAGGASVVIWCAAVLSIVAVAFATQITYLDL